jgi:hypothetical protein
MSILVGTSTGKLYGYSISKKKVVGKRGESALNQPVVGLDYLDQVFCELTTGKLSSVLETKWRTHFQ